MSEQESDWTKPFPDRYLAAAAADAMARLEHWLNVVGMSGNDSFNRLRSEFIKHGSVTFVDITRDI